jgi:hypothetical protein
LEGKSILVESFIKLNSVISGLSGYTSDLRRSQTLLGCSVIRLLE